MSTPLSDEARKSLRAWCNDPLSSLGSLSMAVLKGDVLRLLDECEELHKHLSRTGNAHQEVGVFWDEAQTRVELFLAQFAQIERILREAPQADEHAMIQEICRRVRDGN